ncbi:MAG: YkgJ family cysteine cluster protein [bacterium]|nr:YkgJ family cysteine cluster protein [bacterium]
MNAWLAKFIRTFTAFLPIAPGRRGKCNGCGDCCKFAITCPFSKRETDGKYKCLIYSFRPLNCRKYPRAEREFITKEKCGYWFE